MLMFNENGGFHNFNDEDVAQARKDGWVDGKPVRDRILAAKSPKKPDTITIHEPEPPRRGRPRKVDVIDTDEV